MRRKKESGIIGMGANEICADDLKLWRKHRRGLGGLCGGMSTCGTLGDYLNGVDNGINKHDEQIGKLENELRYLRDRVTILEAACAENLSLWRKQHE